MHHSTFTDEELKRAAAALLYVKRHGNAYECQEFMGAAAREWYRDFSETRSQRETAAFWIAEDVRKLLRQPEDRCTQAANEAIVGSAERAQFDELIRYARRLREQLEAKAARRSA